MSTAWNIIQMKRSVDIRRQILEDNIDELRKKNPAPPVTLETAEVYWSLSRKSKRATKKNQGWVFSSYIHATVKDMKRLMESNGWYLPYYKLSPCNVLFCGCVDRDHVMEFAKSICTEEYSEKMIKSSSS